MKPVAVPANALGDRVVIDEDTPGWVSNGHWAVLATAEHYAAAVADPFALKRSYKASLDFGAPRTPLEEVRSERIEPVAAIEAVISVCPTCDHERTAKPYQRGDLGQRIYAGGGVETLVDGRYAEILDGLSVVRLGTKELDPVAGIDADGDIVAVVLPMRMSARRAVGR